MAAARSPIVLAMMVCAGNIFGMLCRTVCVQGVRLRLVLRKPPHNVEKAPCDL